MRHGNIFKNISLSFVWLWMILFALLPFCLIITTSFMSHNESNLLSTPFTIVNYQQLSNSIFLRIFEKSFFIAVFSTLLCLIIGYPFAYIIAHIQGRLKSILILLLMIPFWTSSLIRSYALIAFIKAKGILNSILITLGLIHHPLPLLFTNYAVMIG